MTLVKSASAPLFVVIGASGNQGGSVVKALAASGRPYRVRAIMRDTSKPVAKQLEALSAETRAADVSTVDGAKFAFKGASLAFCNTVSEYEPPNAVEPVRSSHAPSTESRLTSRRSQEFQKGKTQLDAVKAAGIKSVAWAGLPDLKKLSGLPSD